MTRSSWKHGYVDACLFHRKGKMHQIGSHREQIGELTLKEMERTWSRRSIILPELVGRTIEVHRGNGFVPIKIVSAMVGHKFGEFAFTRKGRSRKKNK